MEVMMAKREESWFDHEDAAEAASRERTTGKQIAILAVLLVATLGTGAALGAFDGAPAIAPLVAPAPAGMTAEQSRAHGVAEKATSTTLLPDRPLFVALETIASSRSLGASETETEIADVVPLGMEPMVIEPIKAQPPTAPTRPARRPTPKPPLVAKAVAPKPAAEPKAAEAIKAAEPIKVSEPVPPQAVSPATPEPATP
ncbi:MAG: hypothetical protein ACI9MR_000656, partial [Myxococcota bacterium]